GGSNFGRPSRIEGEAAIDLLSLLPHADMVKFAKHGSNVTTAAVKLARAYTNREIVAICSDHTFFSFDDWFIGTTAAAPSSSWRSTTSACCSPIQQAAPPLPSRPRTPEAHIS